ALRGGSRLSPAAVTVAYVVLGLYRVPEIVTLERLPGEGRGRFKVANQGGSSCRLRYPYAGILMRRSCAVWPGEPTTVLRFGGFWRLRRSMTVRRTEAAKIGGIGLQIIRAWVLRFNARGPDALLNGKSPGQPCKLNDLQWRAIAGMIESGPI